MEMIRQMIAEFSELGIDRHETCFTVLYGQFISKCFGIFQFSLS